VTLSQLLIKNRVQQGGGEYRVFNLYSSWSWVIGVIGKYSLLISANDVNLL